MRKIKFVFNFLLCIGSSFLFSASILLTLSNLKNIFVAVYNPSDKKKCIYKDSILSSFNNKKTLLFVIDAFPTNLIYREHMGYDSKLHTLLNSVAKESINRLTVYPSTFYSLQYLLGKKTHPSFKCVYPHYAWSNSKPKLVFGESEFFLTGGYCSKIFTNNLLISKIFRSHNACNLANKDIVEGLINKLTNNLDESNAPVHIIHDFSFHSIKKLDSDSLASCKANYPSRLFKEKKQISLSRKIEYIDICLRKSIAKILDSPIYELYDNIIVMSDHGPRYILNNKNKPIELNELLLNSNKDALNDHFYTYFAYYVKSSSNKPLSDLFPPNPSTDPLHLPLNSHHRFKF